MPVYCMHCGAELGAGRFCTNCGTPVGSATPPVAIEPAAPAPVVPAPSAPPATPPATPATPATPDGSPTSREHLPHWGGWLVLAVGVLVAALLGSCLARAGRDEPKDQSAEPTSSASTTWASPSTGSPTPADTGRAGVDLAHDATVTAPRPIRPGTDLAGHRVPYPATNMLDGRRDSAYRLAGDATGTVIRFDLGADRTVTAVGLVNGYAKVDGTTNWYPLNRRIQRVEWRFADGTTVQQDLVDTPDLQAMQVAPEQTSWIELRLVQVSKPGNGHRGKDTTAISDVLLLGS